MKDQFFADYLERLEDQQHRLHALEHGYLHLGHVQLPARCGDRGRSRG